MRASLGYAVALLVLIGCDDGAGDDAGPFIEEDAGMAVPVSTDHCAYEAVPATGGAGGMVESGALSAGTAEAMLDLPLGTSLGSYTGRAEGFGDSAFLPDPDNRRTQLAGTFAPSVGLETIPRVRGLALSAGGETVVILKVDISLSYQGFVHDVEAALGPEYSGKVIVATSHTHSSFGNYTGHTALFLGFGELRDSVYSAMISQLTAVAQQAIGNLEPAQIGFHLDDQFDPDDRVNRDRRSENDEIAGGRMDDNQLFMIRVDTAAGEPMAMLPVFGMHGTIHGEGNTLISTDSSGGLERVLEETFDTDVLVMHLQGAGGDVSPAGNGATDCSGREVCADYSRPESIGHYARDEIRAAYDAAGAAMETDLAIEMLTRTVPLGPDWSTFTVRDGELEYAPWDGRTDADGVVYDESGAIASPIDEFNAPYGAGLCGAGDDLGLRLPRAKLRGTDGLREFSYFNCNKIDAISNVLSTLVDIPFEDPPLCETTRTVVSALRIGEWMIGTLPGEPTTLLRNHLQTLSPTGPARTIIVGYSQDHGGYLLRPEDWLVGGYEPSITFWGPLEGEYVAEQAASVMALAMTPEREDGNAEGVMRPATPSRPDNIPLDMTTGVGTVPGSLPSYVLTHNLQVPPSVQPAAQVERMQNVFFTFIGDDPMRGGTPRVFLQRETAPDTWEDVTRRSGRPVMDGDMLFTWTPDPIQRGEGAARTHYYTVEFQAATPLGMPTLEAVGDRTGLPLGNYRFRVLHSEFEITSDAFEVVAATLNASVETSGTSATVTLGVLNENGYRLIDMTPGTDINGLVPLRTQAVTALIEPAAGPARMESLMTNDMGQVTVPDAVAATVTLTDRFGNQAVVTP